MQDSKFVSSKTIPDCYIGKHAFDTRCTSECCGCHSICGPCPAIVECSALSVRRRLL